MRKKTTSSSNEQAEIVETKPKTAKKKADTEVKAVKETNPKTVAKAKPAVKAAETAPVKAVSKKPATKSKTAKPVADAAPAETTGKTVRKPAAKKTSEPAAKPVQTKKASRPTSAPPVDAASHELSVLEFRSPKSKPAALKSLAELIEEEKSKPKQPKSRRQPVKAEASQPPAPAPAPTQAQNKSRRGRNARDERPARAESALIESLETLDSEVFENDLTVYWRAASEAKPRTQRGRPAQKAQVADPGTDTSEEESDGRAPRRSRRRRRRGDRPDQELTAADAIEPGDLVVEFRGKPKPAEPKPEPVPVMPAKPAIPVPADAPKVVIRGGVPTLVRNGKVLPPLAFFASAPDERRANTVFGEIRRASEAGIHIHSILVEFEVDLGAVDAAVGFAAFMLAQVLAIDPEAQVIFRLVFASPKAWDEKYPRAVYLTQSGRLAEPSVCDTEYWSTAENCLREFVRQTRLLDNSENILGVHLDRGEWFYPEGIGYDTSEAATHAFRDWLRARYVNDLVAFRAAWFDGQVLFNSVHVPEYKSPQPEAENFMRTSRRERRWVDYHLFLSDTTCRRIADLAYAAKESSDGYFLVGVSYGYTFEWSHPASGHLSLGKLLRTREVDFIAGPPSYRSREPGGDAPFPCPVDSLALNGKLYISEEDFKTAIGDYKEPDDYNPVIRTPQALEAVHWRGIGAALAHKSGAMWMDLWGNGWLNTASIWDRGAKAKECLIQLMAAQPTNPDVAVFIDERALAYLIDERSFSLLVQDVRESVYRSGLSAGFYLLSDLAHRENFPECKLYIFLNPWDIRPEHRMAIKNRLQKDNKVLFWLYCAGMFDNGREALERAREITGIAIKPQPFQSKTGTTLLNRRHALSEAFAEKGLIGGQAVDPSYFAIPEGALVLGEYSQSGLPSFVLREFNEDPDPSKHWKSVFLGEPFVTPGLMRGLAQIAGAHIWSYNSDVVHVRAPFLTVHCTGTGQRTIALPRTFEAYDLISGQWATEGANTIRFQAMDGSTHIFLVGEKHDIEALLSIDRETLLQYVPTQEELEAEASSEENMLFDVPIMRLDEFIEGTPDDSEDEWLIGAKLLESAEAAPANEPEDDQKVGRRRRRRGGRDRGRDGDTRGGRSEAVVMDDFEMNVMFRKRD